MTAASSACLLDYSSVSTGEEAPTEPFIFQLGAVPWQSCLCWLHQTKELRIERLRDPCHERLHLRFQKTATLQFLRHGDADKEATVELRCSAGRSPDYKGRSLPQPEATTSCPRTQLRPAEYYPLSLSPLSSALGSGSRRGVLGIRAVETKRKAEQSFGFPPPPVPGGPRRPATAIGGTRRLVLPRVPAGPRVSMTGNENQECKRNAFREQCGEKLVWSEIRGSCLQQIRLPSFPENCFELLDGDTELQYWNGHSTTIHRPKQQQQQEQGFTFDLDRFMRAKADSKIWRKIATHFKGHKGSGPCSWVVTVLATAAPQSWWIFPARAEPLGMSCAPLRSLPVAVENKHGQ
ncbi:hypothetical protein MUK42_12348 [Musa troglodytarum]|uniref:Uncharacterized protein n=1 Tax=Musa troglodytarum TaxID=320322 RepID=A0A9E7K1B0_9LILI|nr:hypothetical protein MUK42_12348 [Musa troglodytarum]